MLDYAGDSLWTEEELKSNLKNSLVGVYNEILIFIFNWIGICGEACAPELSISIDTIWAHVLFLLLYAGIE